MSTTSRPMPIEEMVRQFKSHHPTSHLLRIDNFSLLRKHQVHICESTVFQINGYKWKLVLYPNGKGRIEKNKGNKVVSLDMELQDSTSLPYNSSISVKLLVFVLSQQRQVWEAKTVFADFRASTPAWGSFFDVATLYDKRHGYLVGDCCLIGTKILNFPSGGRVGTAECLTMIENPPDHKVTWKILKFSTFNQPFHAYESEEFTVGRRKWKIVMYPKGFPEEDSNSFSVYLHGFDYMDGTRMTRTYAKFKLRLLNQLDGKHAEMQIESWFPIHPSQLDSQKFIMPLQDLHNMSKGYLVDDKLYIQVQFDVISMTNHC